MSDDWRLRIELATAGQADELRRLLGTEGLEHDLDNSFGDRVVVSADGAEAFCYAGSREQAQRARTVIERLAEREGWPAKIELTRWHPVAERWEDPDAPLPAGDTPDEPEHLERIERERQESARHGYPDFEVHVRCNNRHGARELAERLESEGITNVQRWSYVVVGATDEDAANALAERLRGEAGEDVQITIQDNTLALPSNPFAVLGGLGG
ncbi:MAG: SPOR domain-containing protein [Solirubrobacteraceae bacterium]